MKKGKDPAEGDEQDQYLWKTVTRSIKAYPPTKTQAIKRCRLPIKEAPRTTMDDSGAYTPHRRGSYHPSGVSPQHISPQAKGFDRSTETKLRRGQLPLEGRLDLHGMTQQKAFDMLCQFIQSALAQGKRTVLVITGKGGVQTPGILKQMLPLWLEDAHLSQYIIAIAKAAPKHGGAGAFYLRLKKKVKDPASP